MSDNGVEVDPWYYDDNIPGSGARPEYLEPKYKSLADQAKGYKELRKSFGALSGAPEAYDVENFKDSIDFNNPAIKNLMEYGKANRINQDAFGTFLNVLKDYEQSYIPNLDQELGKLEGGQQRFDVVSQWAKNTLSQSAFETFNDIPKTAETIAFFDELRQRESAARQTGGAGLQSQIDKPSTMQELKAELNANYRRYCDDPHYRMTLENKMALASGG